MSLHPSTDKRPVYLGTDGKPLANGKLEYCIVGQTTPKTVYTDRLLTTPASNPQILGIDGRTETEIFLGTGDYTVFASSFIGLDPNTAPPEDWVPDNQWDESGATASSIDPASVGTIGTISELRSLTPTDGIVDVLGYYAYGDCETRRYVWDASDLTDDDGGLTIANGAIATGRWKYVSDSDTINVAVYGILPSRSGANNGALQAMSTGLRDGFRIARTIFFPSGIYEFTSGDISIYVDMQLSKGVQFKNTAVSNVNINCYYGFKAELVDYINAASGVGMVLFDFSGSASNIDVAPIWYRDYSDTNDTYAWDYMLNRISPSCTINVSSIQQIQGVITPFNLDINNKVKFNDAYLNLAGGSNLKVRLLAGCSIESSNKYACFAGDFTQLVPYGISEVRTSWFLKTTAGNVTQDLGAILTALKGNTITAGTNCSVVYDAAVNRFTTAYEDYQTMSHAHEFGVIETTYAINSADTAKFNAISGLSSASLSGSIVILDGETELEWFRNSSSITTTFQEASHCAFKGNGVLNMNNISVSLSATATQNANFGSFNPNVVIKNGRLFPSNNVPVFAVIGGSVAVFFDRCTVSYGSGNSGAMLVTGSGATLSNVQFNNCSASSTAGKLIDSSTGTTQKLTLNDTTINVAYLSSGAGCVSMTTNAQNSTITGVLATTGGSVKMSRCSVRADGIWYIRGSAKTHISNCDFTNTTVVARDASGVFACGFTDNHFTGSVSVFCSIVLESATPNAIISGAYITGNRFVQSGTFATTKHIYAQASGAGSFENTYTHKLVVKDNQGTFACPATEGTDILEVYLVGGGSNVATVAITSGNNASKIFVIPSSVPNFIASSANGTSILYDYGAYYINSNVTGGTVDMYLRRDFTDAGYTTMIFTFKIYGN